MDRIHILTIMQDLGTFPSCLTALSVMQLTTNLIKKAEEGVNGLMAKLGAPADLSQHSPHASVQQLLHATKSLTELSAGSALGNLQVCDRLGCNYIGTQHARFQSCLTGLKAFSHNTPLHMPLSCYRDHACHGRPLHMQGLVCMPLPLPMTNCLTMCTLYHDWVPRVWSCTYVSLRSKCNAQPAWGLKLFCGVQHTALCKGK